MDGARLVAADQGKDVEPEEFSEHLLAVAMSKKT